MILAFVLFFFFFNDTATTEIYTLSLHDALPISCAAALQAGRQWSRDPSRSATGPWPRGRGANARRSAVHRSEEHTSELQSQSNLVCRLLLEKKKKTLKLHINTRTTNSTQNCRIT